MTAHSKLSASTCERWWNCPGSIALIATVPPQQPSKYAEEGTAAHELAALCLRDGSEALDHVGNWSDNGYEFTDEMAEAVQVYLDCIRADMAQYNTRDILVEHTFHLPISDTPIFGTCDCCLPIALDRLIVYDYKHGQGVAVEVENNKQALFYALGASLEGDYDTIEMVIIQPRAPHADGRIRRWVITAAELMEFEEQLKTQVDRAEMPDASLKCGKWCEKTFCPALAVCPAVRARVERDAMVVFQQPVKVLPPPETLTPLQLRRLLEGAPLIEAWLKAVWGYAEQQANAGKEVLGFKLVQGREGNRKWIEEEKVKELLLPLKIEIYEKKLLSPSKIEKVLGKSKGLIKDLVTRTEGKIILVPENDPRPEAKPNAIKAFESNDEIE